MVNSGTPFVPFVTHELPYDLEGKYTGTYQNIELVGVLKKFPPALGSQNPVTFVVG